MADTLAEDFGVAARWLEGESRTTWENAQFTAAMLASRRHQTHRAGH